MKERFFLILVILLLVSVWFRKGLIIGSGESGLPFYNTTKLLELTQNSWTDVPLGTSGSIGSASSPFYLTVTFFMHLGVSAFLLQAIMYFLLISVGTLAIHKMASYISDNSYISRMSSSLFYIFNPILLVSGLHRVQYPLIFFYSFMPLAFMIYFYAIRFRKFENLIILALLSVVFSFSFIGIAFVELLFGVIGLLSFSYFALDNKPKFKWHYLLYLIGFIVIFCLINAWWITPLVFSVSSDLGARASLKYFSNNDNVETFISISERLRSVLSVFRLFPPYAFPDNESSWGWIYGTYPFVVLSFFSIFAFLIGLFKKNKEWLYKYLIFICLVTMFCMKGSLPPFGSITLLLFKSSTLLQAFRNPFEKIGMLLPFAMAIPLGFGVEIIIKTIAGWTNRSKKIITFAVLILIFPVYMFPILTGYAFTGGPPPTNIMSIGQYVKVPEYYQEARNWLNNQQGIFRVLSLPIAGEGMTYKWDYGFSGVELSNNLLDQSIISFNSSQGNLPEMIDVIKSILAQFPEKLSITTQLLNVKYVMVRDDIDFLDRQTEDPKKDAKIIEESLAGSFPKVAEFGKLKFYEVNSENFTPRVYAKNSAVYIIDPYKNGLDLVPFIKPQTGDIYVNSADYKASGPLSKLSKEMIIDSVRVSNVKINTKNPVEELPYVTTYPESRFYSLVRLKEKIETQFQTRNKLLFKVSLLGKRLLEVNHDPKNDLTIDEYTKFFDELSAEIKQNIPVDAGIVNSLLNQRQLLDEIKPKAGNQEKINKVISDLDNFFIDIRVKSIYPTKKDVIYRFNTPKIGKYEIIISKEKWDYYFKDTIIDEIDLDGRNIKLPYSERLKISNCQKEKEKCSKENTISLGAYELDQGFHEISIDPPQPVNLVEDNFEGEMDLAAKDRKPFTRVFPLVDVDNNYAYTISVEALLEKGNDPIMLINSDIDTVDRLGEKIPVQGKVLERNNYDYGWKKYTALLTPLPAASKFSIDFKILPYGDCKSAVQRPYRRYCQNPDFNSRFLRESSAKIRNLTVEKIFQDSVLIKEISEPVIANVSIPQIDFEKISPARYKVKVKNAQNPFLLILSTSFDPGWKAYFISDFNHKSLFDNLTGSYTGVQVDDGNHLEVNGYANSWYIDKNGDYEMFLEYKPERTFVLSRNLSFFFIFSALLILVSRRVYAGYFRG